MTNPYLDKLRDQEKRHPEAPSKPSKPISRVVDPANTTSGTGFEGFEGGVSRGFSETRESNGEMAPEGESTKNPTSGYLQNPQNPRFPSVQVCVQCGVGDDLWHLDTPSGPVLIHEECARFWPGAPPALPSAAIHQEASSDPGGITTEVRIFTLPPAGRYRKVFLHLQRKPPAHVPTDRWEQAVEDAKTFLRQWGSQAESLGWSSADLFGLHAPPEHPRPSYSRLSRLDATGLVWLLQGRSVVALTETTAAIQSATGNVTVYRKHNKPGLGPLGDSLDDLK